MNFHIYFCCCCCYIFFCDDFLHSLLTTCHKQLPHTLPSNCELFAVNTIELLDVCNFGYTYCGILPLSKDSQS
jgi:hypothetical protein